MTRITIAGMAVGAILVLAVGGVYARSEQVIRRTYDVPEPKLLVPVPAGDSEAIAEGERLGAIRGCVGCHTRTLGGKVAFDISGRWKLVSADLTTGEGGVGGGSDARLARAITLGVRHDGRGVFGMPSAAFHDLDPTDLALLIAWIRSKPPVAASNGAHEFRWLARWDLARGALHSVAEGLPALPAARRAPPYGATAEYGGYLARTICSECHGADLTGGAHAPSLAVVASYDSAAFDKLLLEGFSKDGRPAHRVFLVERYEQFHPEERVALYGYLHSTHRAATAP